MTSTPPRSAATAVEPLRELAEFTAARATAAAPHVAAHVQRYRDDAAGSPPISGTSRSSGRSLVVSWDVIWVLVAPVQAAWRSRQPWGVSA